MHDSCAAGDGDAFSDLKFGEYKTAAWSPASVIERLEHQFADVFRRTGERRVEVWFGS